jgi:hypothetical protein
MEISTQKTSLTPRFFFISLGVLVALITSVSSFLVLYFETLNKKFPDVLTTTYQYGYNSYTYDTIRSTLATLIIFFPVYLLLAYYWRKLSKSDLGIKDNIIFKWMIYLVLFLSSLLIVIDLVTLVNYFVSGEITIRFIFKVIGAALVATLVGFNYFSELKNHDKIDSKNKISIICLSVSVVFFLGLIIWSFTIMGSPTQQRVWRLDDRRISDLQNIQSQIISYWQQKEKLPISLIELSDPISGYSLPVDPEFEIGKIYEYTPKENLSFELCATFGAEMPKDWKTDNFVNVTGPVVTGGETRIDVSVPVYPKGINESWNHSIGRSCFTRTIDKDLYPPIKK